MPKAYLAYYSDYVLGGNGQPIGGAAVRCYPTSAFANGVLPTGGDPGGATMMVTSDNAGKYAFAGLPPDDYHILVDYTPLGGVLQHVWRYHQPIVAVDLVKRLLSSVRSSLIPRTISR